jgi:ATP-dependent exoDNAse (exonuclease V) beta subunit
LNGLLFPIIADENERSRALDPLRSFIVQAPAGSGKTDLLVRRYIRLLETVRQPEEVLAITFTIKAAAEMRQRVLKKLPRPDLGHRLRIQTIDALCASLTRQMPVRSRFGAQPQLVEDARAHYREAAKRALQALSPPAVTLLSHLDNNVGTATGLLASMLAKRDQWLRTTGAVPSRHALETNLALERERLLAAAQALDPRVSEDFARTVLTDKRTWRQRPTPAPADIVGNEPLRKALSALLDMPPARYTDYQWEVLEAILKLLPYAAAHLKVVFGERGECDFTEVAQGAVRALGTPDAPTDLLLALDYRIRHILVDEFQDTSNSQWELIERMTAGWERGDGRTLFLVGDPMQSIYRFREAEVALFLRAQREGMGSVTLERLTLSTNFRSQAGLVSFFNGTFEQIFPGQEDPPSGAVPYSAAAPHPENLALPGEAASWSFHADRQAEARAVLELVKASKDRTAILVRSREALAEIVPALKQEGIRFRAIEIERLGERPVVQDLYALTCALSHLGDRVAWLSILRAPWCGLTLNELHAIAGADRFATVWDLIQETQRLETLRAILGPAIANRGRGSLRERVEGVWLALGGPACVENETDLEDAEIFLDQLEGLERAGDVEDMGALAEALQQLYALPDVAAGDDDLQIMTIHKAKGLEFGTVIVPGLDRIPGRSDAPLFLWKERPPAKGGRASGRLVLAPIKETGSKADSAYQYLAALDSEAEKMEASRLLYVAATRAEHRLHLLGCVRCEEDGTPKRPYSHSLLARAWPVAEQHAVAVTPNQIQQTNPRSAFTSFTRLSTDLTTIRPAEPARWTAPPEGREEEQIEFSWAGEIARHAGTVVHRWLQRIAEDELRGWDAKRIASSKKLFGRELQRRGVAPADLERSVELVAAALKNTLSDERGRWILGTHAEARSEYRMRVRTPEGRRTLVMDRVFRDRDGRLWVVDFKTSRHEGAAVEAFLDRERERYAAQLDAYAAALGGASRGLYFPLHSGWRGA